MRKLSDDIKIKLQKNCDLTIKEDIEKIRFNYFEGWKVIGIIDTSEIYTKLLSEKGLQGSCLSQNYQLCEVFIPGTDMWFDKFELGLYSLNYKEEVLLFISPSKDDIYSITGYEDIIGLLKDNFLVPFLTEDINGDPFLTFNSTWDRMNPIYTGFGGINTSINTVGYCDTSDITSKNQLINGNVVLTTATQGTCAGPYFYTVGYDSDTIQGTSNLGN